MNKPTDTYILWLCNWLGISFYQRQSKLTKCQNVKPIPFSTTLADIISQYKFVGSEKKMYKKMMPLHRNMKNVVRTKPEKSYRAEDFFLNLSIIEIFQNSISKKNENFKWK
jgi:hypothetical protein